MVDWPSAAYIHLPFCRHHCGYCDFPVIAGRDDLLPRLLEALGIELSGLERERPVKSLYLGGGTPSHLPVESLEELIRLARDWFPLLPGHEFTVEANPADVTAGWIESLARLEVTRVSLGVQSFDKATLGLLERDHDEEMIRAAVGFLQDAAIDISLDLMFAVPGQTIGPWKRDLEKALELAPGHFSIQGLTVEPSTPLHARVVAGELVKVDEELQRQMYLAAIERLPAAGYEHYEITSFSLPGHRSRQSEAYWNGSGYFAAGPGATRFVNGRRETNHRDTVTYLDHLLSGRSPVSSSEQLSPEMVARERLVFGLCQLEGIEAGVFLDETGFSLPGLMGECLELYQAQGLLEWDKSILRLTRDGLLLSDSLWPSLLEPLDDDTRC